MGSEGVQAGIVLDLQYIYFPCVRDLEHVLTIITVAKDFMSCLRLAPQASILVLLRILGGHKEGH